nr:glycosyltransferase [Chromatiaceae bacterium]
ALGTPVVATDCPSGPAELLDSGRIAPLVPVGDVAALAQAIGATLDRPPPREVLKAAVADYDQGRSARNYLEELDQNRVV